MYCLSILRKPPTLEYHAPKPSTSNDNELEVSAIVSEFTQRLKRLEEGLVDQKVKLEILDLRVNRELQKHVSSPPLLFEETRDAVSAELPRGRQQLVKEAPRIANDILPDNRLTRDETRTKSFQTRDDKVDQRPGSTKLEALRIVFEGRGNTTAKEIEQRIGRAREHTARMMNGLYREGLVDRNVRVRPFAYSITQKGRDLLNS